MAYCNYDSSQYLRTGLQANDADESLDLPHWPGSPLMFYRPFGTYYHVSNAPHLVQEQDHTTSPAYQPIYNFSNPPCHTPGEELQPPYFSSPSTSYNSSTSASSDRLSPSMGSRASSLLPSPTPCHIELFVPGLELTPYSNGGYNDSTYVAMDAIQKQADATHDDPIDHSNGYGPYGPQELVLMGAEYDEPAPSPYGQLPIPVLNQEIHEDTPSEPEPAPESEPESDYQPNLVPTLRRRRAPKQQPLAATKGHNGVKKRRLTQHATKSSRNPTEIPRAFLCPLAPYGCSSAFNAKNEWKRHALTQHFRLGFWRCDQCKESPDRPNDFNRKDLFIQHVRRMHPTDTVMPTISNSKNKGRAHGRVAAVEAALNKIAARCYQLTHSAPESCCCVFCEEKFEGDGAVETRIEHVGKHMESRRKDGLAPVAVVDWSEDKELESWLLLHGMIVKRKGLLEVSR
jgi:hypothetical protein